jgi:3-hydroxyisobutyrate dehydrogenase-like beta-hydroxyacid dehydrogenase
MGTRVAVLGTGRMGSAIARRLAEAGHDLTLWSRTREHAESVGVGRVADTPASAVGAADIVISSLTGAEALRTVYLGPDGAIQASTGQIFIDMSTAGSDVAVELEPPIAARGSHFLAVPILGAPTVVGEGKGTLLAGGDASIVEQALPMLELLGSVRYVGSVMSAARLKLVANSMLAALVEAAAELQVAGEGADLDPGDVFWVLTRLAPGLESRRAGLIESRHEPALFALRDLNKDVNLAQALFVGSAERMPLIRNAADLIGAAAAVNPDLDISAVSRPYRGAVAAKQR